jgi:hypothetical protein
MKAILLRSAARHHSISARFRHAVLVLVITLIACAPLAFSFQSAAGLQRPAVDSEAFRIKAAAQYELVDLYISNGEPDKAAIAARQIIQPPIPSEYEEAVVASMGKISDKLKNLKRFDLAQPLLDDALKVIVQVPCRVELWQMKSKLYYLSGENEKAIEAWRRAKAEEVRRVE